MAEPGPSAAVQRRLPAARELTVVMLMGIAGSQVLDENWSARKRLRPSQRAAGRRGGQLPGPVPGLVDVRARGADDRFQPDRRRRTSEGRHVDPYNEVANPKYPNPGFTIPVSLGPSWIFYGYGNHIPNRGAYHQALLEWILRYPKRTGRPQDQITSFTVWKVEDDSPPLGEQKPRNLRWNVMIKYP